MNEKIGEEKEWERNTATCYCNLGKLQLAIISDVYNSCRQMLHCFAFVITPAKPQLKEK